MKQYITMSAEVGQWYVVHKLSWLKEDRRATGHCNEICQFDLSSRMIALPLLRGGWKCQ